MHVSWNKVLGGGKAAASPALLTAFVPASSPKLSRPKKSAPVCAVAAPTPQCIVTLDTILELAHKTAGQTVDADVPLMDSGIDSLGAVDMRNNLQQAAGGDIALPSTLVFDHPTARQLTTFFAEAAPSPVACQQTAAVSLETVL